MLMLLFSSLVFVAEGLSSFRRPVPIVSGPQRYSLCLVDGDNVRGKIRFGLSKQALVEKIESASLCAEKVVVFLDHGICSDEIALEKVSVAFSGPGVTADDCIAARVGIAEGSVFVATSDSELASRCRKAARARIDIMEATKFADVVLQASEEEYSFDDSLEVCKNLETIAKRAAGSIVSSRQQKRRRSREAVVPLRRANAPSLDEEIASVVKDASLSDVRSAVFQAGGLRKHREETWERVLFAAQYHASLRTFAPPQKPPREKIPPRRLFRVRSIEKNLQQETETKSWHDLEVLKTIDIHESPDVLSDLKRLQLTIPRGRLSVGVASDTHGFESEFTFDEDHPEEEKKNGIFVHCGDFAVDGRSKENKDGAIAFDNWLASQPFTHSIVCRGNHDPPFLTLKNAHYLTTPTIVDFTYEDSVLAFQMLVIPYGHYRTAFDAPSKIDVLVTHHPPRGILDRTYSGVCAGSAPLRGALNKGHLRPKLWLCGHIHESAGAATLISDFEDDTIFLVNAANANSGRAARLVRPPLKFALNLLQEKETPIQEEEKKRPAARSRTSSFDVLVAVDLGLTRVGAAAFDVKSKRLLAYAAGSRVDEAVEQLKLTNSTTAMLVTEGSDRALRDDAVQCLKDVPNFSDHDILVAAHHWREDLLLPKEMQNARLAKEAARQIAKQIIHRDLQTNLPKPTTDAAEAICLGTWAANELRVLKTELSHENKKSNVLVDRYLNGDVILPRLQTATSSSHRRR